MEITNKPLLYDVMYTLVGSTGSKNEWQLIPVMILNHGYGFSSFEGDFESQNDTQRESEISGRASKEASLLQAVQTQYANEVSLLQLSLPHRLKQ